MRLTTKTISIALIAITGSLSFAHADDFLSTGKVTATDPNTNKKIDIQVFGRSSVPNEYNVVRFFSLTPVLMVRSTMKKWRSGVALYLINLNMFECQ
jgi:hypothetical protein